MTQRKLLDLDELRLPASASAHAAMAAVTRLKNAGFAAYLVGGCVRDLLLGLGPKDYDVATDAIPEQVREVFGKVIEVGAAFGVLRVPLRCFGERVEIEVATFRAERSYSDGRRPDQVRFTDAREDVLRRDFTVNGLLLGVDPERSDGRLVVADFVNGVADLQNGVLRAIGRPLERFEEDHLRVLRLVRFATRFSLTIEAQTWEAALRAAPQLPRISWERVREEVLRTLSGPDPRRGVELFAQLGVGEQLWAGLLRDQPLSARSERFGQAKRLLASEPTAQTDSVATAVTSRSGGDYPAVTAIDTPLALALLFDVEDEAANGAQRAHCTKVGAQFKLSRAEVRALERVLSVMSSLREKPEGSALICLLRREMADHALVALHACEPEDPLWPQLRIRRSRALRSEWNPALVVDGAALRSRGYRPSPAFRTAIAAAEAVQLGGGDEAQVWQAALEAMPSLSTT